MICPLSVNWGTVADWASAVMALLVGATAAYSAFIAARTYRSSEENKKADEAHRRWVDAKALYVECLNDQIRHPEFRPDNWQEAQKDPAQAQQYRVFMNKLLWSLEGMVKVDSDTQEWKRSAEDIGRAWAEFFVGDKFLAFEWELYSDELREAVAKGVNNVLPPVPGTPIAFTNNQKLAGDEGLLADQTNGRRKKVAEALGESAAVNTIGAAA